MTPDWPWKKEPHQKIHGVFPAFLLSCLPSLSHLFQKREVHLDFSGPILQSRVSILLRCSSDAAGLPDPVATLSNRSLGHRGPGIGVGA